MVSVLYGIGSCLRLYSLVAQPPEETMKFEAVILNRPNGSEQQCERENSSQMKRKRSTTNCHQCHQNDEQSVIRCSKCKKQYCIRCIKWYPKIDKAAIAECCPSCRNICNCGACLQSEGPSNIQDLSSRVEEIYNISAHVINVVLPILKKHSVEAETQDDEALQLIVRAEAIVRLFESTEGRAFETTCSCRTSDAKSANSLKAASRDDGIENYLYCLVAGDTETSDLQHFQTHLSNGEPVIVRDVLSGGSGFSWEPTVIERAIRSYLQKASDSMDLTVTNCTSFREEKINIRKFFSGYSKGLFDHQGHPKFLTLEWSSSKTFREKLPRYYGELVRCLPFKHYIHSVSACGTVPVKMSVSCGPNGGIEHCGTKLQYDLFDGVNILMHVASSTSALAESSNTLQDAELGTEWDIFRKQDVPKLEEFLNKRAEEMKHSIPLHQMVHPDHHDAVYLTVDDKKKLKDEYGIEPWTFMQKLGDAVFVPAGCFYQTRNLKSCIHVAVDFVSPESLSESENMFERRRSLPSDNFQKEHKLKMRKLLRDMVTHAVENWEKIPGVLMSEETCSLGLMKQITKMMKLLLERDGHKVPPAGRNKLEDEIQKFLNLFPTSSKSRVS